MVFESPAEFVVAVLGIAIGVATLVAAITERPPAIRVPRPLVALSCAWAVGYAIAAWITAVQLHHHGVAGILVAASLGSVSAAIWGARSGPRGGGGGGGGAEREPDGPPAPQVPDEYWERWEEQLSGVVARR